MGQSDTCMRMATSKKRLLKKTHTSKEMTMQSNYSAKYTATRYPAFETRLTS